MVVLPPDMSTIHIHNLPVRAAVGQAVTAGGLALLQEFCKHRKWAQAATAPSQYFRVSCDTSAQTGKEGRREGNQVPASASAGRF